MKFVDKYGDPPEPKRHAYSGNIRALCRELKHTSEDSESFAFGVLTELLTRVRMLEREVKQRRLSEDLLGIRAGSFGQTCGKCSKRAILVQLDGRWLGLALCVEHTLEFFRKWGRVLDEAKVPLKSSGG